MSDFFDDFFQDAKAKRQCVDCDTTENLTPYGQDFHICPKCRKQKDEENKARAEKAYTARKAGEHFDAQ